MLLLVEGGKYHYILDGSNMYRYELVHTLTQWLQGFDHLELRHMTSNYHSYNPPVNQYLYDSRSEISPELVSIILEQNPRE